MRAPRDNSRNEHHRPSTATLTDLVDVDTLQRLQDRFTELGRVTVCICTIYGELITVPSWGSRYSQIIGTSRTGRTEFAKTIAKCVEDCNCQAPAKCHEGMTCYATPILHNGHRLAVIVAGTRVPKPPPVDAIREIAQSYDIDADGLLDAVEQIDPYSGGTPEAIRCFADVLADTISTMYRQAALIEQQLHDLDAVHGMTELLSGSHDLQEILDLTVEQVVALMDVKACGIRLLDNDTGELVVKAVHNLSDEYLDKGPVTLSENAIDAAAIDGQAVYIEDASTDPRVRYPENARREGIVSGLCVPMTYRGTTVGVIRVYTAKRRVFSESEEAMLRSIASQAASAIINSRLHDEQHATERFQRQVKAAGEIQRRMLPREAPSHEHLEFGCVYVPTLQLGGDFCDFIDLPGKDTGVCIADVVGKGLPAALMMASVRSALRASAGRTVHVQGTVSEVNRHMSRDTLSGEFATLFYGVFSADGRSLTYCNAGHPPPMLFRGDDLIELTDGGLVIGVHPDAPYQSGFVTLQQGDVIAMVTDGVSEALDFNDIAYERERLVSSIRRHRSLAAQQLAQQILWDVRRFAGLAEQSDDITILTVKVVR
ncbi:MAG: SpoIIE family protein phosphatase [Phycisphaerales bacterium]|nr:MAG: SpoIIE family protein phosphatase [Phycisphaerales bacterium]